MRRVALLAVGWLAVALGAVGVVVPGLPTTGFFVLAAACFARSSPRFERWVLNLPTVGPLVRDHRAGLGMPRRAKVMAIGTMLVACSLSAWTLGTPVLAGTVLGAGAVGTWYVGWRVPTRERELARRAAAGAGQPA
ncbi:MAG TPA: YbaN family protein [Acidimicrobiales bacterium]|nr:YbaN family protein [Acidimicrobiales bacterium]